MSGGVFERKEVDALKQTAVQVKFDSGRYAALVRYARKKEVSIEKELAETLERLYKRLVPADVREYIEETDSESREKGGAKKKDMTIENGQGTAGELFPKSDSIPENGGES